jgi:hypothetical protein
MTAAERQHQASRDTTAAHLRALREQWGDLLAAVERRPDEVWPPIDNLRALLGRGAEDEPDDRAQVGRLPLVLREYPAPLNADALDAAVAIEVEVFALADRIATAVQRPVQVISAPTFADPQGTYTVPADRDHPARWHLPSARDALLPAPARLLTGTDPRTDTDREWEAENGRPRITRTKVTPGSVLPVASAGSRAYGLHWAAMWIEGRVMDEPEGDLFTPLPLRLLDDARNVAGRCRARLERTLNRDTRTTALPAVCPWCGSGLMGRNTGGDPYAAVIWCTGGPGCGAPVELDAYGRRHWARETLPALWGALEQRGAATA